MFSLNSVKKVVGLILGSGLYFHRIFNLSGPGVSRVFFLINSRIKGNFSVFEDDRIKFKTFLLSLIGQFLLCTTREKTNGRCLKI